MTNTELSFSLAKSALIIHPSLQEIRDFRKMMENLDSQLHDEVPIVVRFPQEWALAYLKRSNLPFSKIEKARRYTSARGQLSYDRIDYDRNGVRTTLFTPHSHNDVLPYEHNLEIDVPSFANLWEDYWKDEGKPESFTTLLHVDSKGMIVTKAYLDQRLTEALRSEAVLPSRIKTGREAAMLQMLHELGIRVPQILGFNTDKTAFAMDYVPGQALLDWVQLNGLTDKDIDDIVNLVINTQKKLATRKELIAENFPPYPAHTGNVALLLNETLERVSDNLWAPHLQGEIRVRFQNVVQILAERFLKKPEYYDSNDAIYGDFAVNNIMRGKTGELTLIDPILSKGRRSMDLGRFGRSLVARNIGAFYRYFPKIVSKYNEISDFPVSSIEVIDMLCVDLLRILSLLLKIPDNQLIRFPGYVKEISRDRLELYINDVIPRLLEKGI